MLHLVTNLVHTAAHLLLVMSIVVMKVVVVAVVVGGVGVVGLTTSWLCVVSVVGRCS